MSKEMDTRGLARKWSLFVVAGACLLTPIGASARDKATLILETPRQTSSTLMDVTPGGEGVRGRKSAFRILVTRNSTPTINIYFSDNRDISNVISINSAQFVEMGDIKTIIVQRVTGGHCFGQELNDLGAPPRDENEALRRLLDADLIVMSKEGRCRMAESRIRLAAIAFCRQRNYLRDRMGYLTFRGRANCSLFDKQDLEEDWEKVRRRLIGR